MGKLEIIYWLTGLIGMHGKYYDEALETAIKVLEQSESDEDKQLLRQRDGMIDKLRELFSDWMKEKKWKKDIGDPLYVYEIYEFLDYIKERKEDSLKW